MDDPECRAKLAQQVIDLLRQMSYEYRITDGIIEIETAYKNVGVKIKIVPVNCTDISLKAAYSVMPIGRNKTEDSKILKWYKNITTRTNLGAGIGLSDDQKIIVTYATARLNKGRRGNIGELIYRIYSMTGHYKCLESDLTRGIAQGFIFNPKQG